MDRIKLAFVSVLFFQATAGFLTDIFPSLPNPLDMFNTLLQSQQSGGQTEDFANALVTNVREFVSDGITNVVSAGAQQAVNPIADFIIALSSEVMESTENLDLKEQAENLISDVEDFKNNFVETITTSMATLLPTIQKVNAPQFILSPYGVANAAADLMENTKDASLNVISIINQFGAENSLDLSDITDMLKNAVETTIDPILDEYVLVDLAYNMTYYICYVLMRVDCGNPFIDFIFEDCFSIPTFCMRHRLPLM